MTPWALLPVKDTVGAKQRLSDVLTVPERQALALRMLQDVLSALTGSCRFPRLGLDIDHRADLMAFMRVDSLTLTRGSSTAFRRSAAFWSPRSGRREPEMTIDNILSRALAGQRLGPDDVLALATAEDLAG